MSLTREESIRAALLDIVLDQALESNVFVELVRIKLCVEVGEPTTEETKHAIREALGAHRSPVVDKAVAVLRDVMGIEFIPPPESGRKIIIMDDSTDSAESISSALSSNGIDSRCLHMGGVIYVAICRKNFGRVEEPGR